MLLFVFRLFLLVLAAASYRYLTPSRMTAVLMGVLASLIVWQIYFKKNDQISTSQLIFALIPISFLVYSATHTSFLSYLALFPLMLFGFSYLLFFLVPIVGWGVTIVVSMSVVGVLAGQKLNSPYNWWMLSEGPTWTADKELSHQYLKKIHVNLQTFQLFETVSKEVRQEDNVYFLPNIPIFYLLNNKIPPTGSLTQWFDVISQEGSRQEIKTFLEAKPNLIVFLMPPEFVFEGHYELKKMRSGLSSIRELLLSLVERGDYKLVLNKIIKNSREDTEFNIFSDSYREKNTIDIQVLKGDFDVFSILSMRSISINKITRNGISYSPAEFVAQENDHIKKFDILNVYASHEEKSQLVEQLGAELSSNNYQLLIMRRL